MATNGMTIDSLNNLSSLTANDEVPVWDKEASAEPTKKITAQNLANSVKSLASLPNTTEMNAAIQQSKANIKIINQGTVNLGQVAPKTRGAVTVTFATPFTNTNYSVVATFAAGSQGFAYAIPQIQSKTTTTVSIGVWNNDASATATVSALDWVAVGT